MDKQITLAKCSEICELASDIEGDVKFCRAYNIQTGSRVGGDCLAFVCDFDSYSIFRLALAIQTACGTEVAMSMAQDMGFHQADRKQVVYFAGWKTK